MNSDKRTILTLIAAGRITPAQAERLLAVVNESRETAWILALCLAGVCLAQLRLHEILPGLVHFFNTQVPALADATLYALGPITKFLGGSL
jgi:hypothetical protein